MPGWLSKFPTANHIVEEHLLANNIPRPRHWPSSLFFHANMEASGSKWNPAVLSDLAHLFWRVTFLLLDVPHLAIDISRPMPHLRTCLLSAELYILLSSSWAWSSLVRIIDMLKTWSRLKLFYFIVFKWTGLWCSGARCPKSELRNFPRLGFTE